MDKNLGEIGMFEQFEQVPPGPYRTCLEMSVSTVGSVSSVGGLFFLWVCVGPLTHIQLGLLHIQSIANGSFLFYFRSMLHYVKLK